MFKSKRLIVVVVLISFIVALSPNSAYAGNPFNLVIKKIKQNNQNIREKSSAGSMRTRSM